eukprot:6840327-Alexandrium_andersonii.AAC.1
MLVGLIFEKAVREPIYCDTYVDLACALGGPRRAAGGGGGMQRAAFGQALRRAIHDHLEAELNWLDRVVAPCGCASRPLRRRGRG